MMKVKYQSVHALKHKHTKTNENKQVRTKRSVQTNKHIEVPTIVNDRVVRCVQM